MSGGVWYLSFSKKKIEFKKYPGKKKNTKIKSSNNKKEVSKTKNFLFVLLFAMSFLFFSTLVSAAPINDTLHINVQSVDGSDAVETGTFTFAFNITATVGPTCVSPVYNHSVQKTTDARGIVSITLPTVGSGGGDLSSLSFDTQYYLCYYRDGTLKDVSQLGRVPYSFRATQVNISELSIDSNLNLTDSFNITANYGFFNNLGSFLNRITSFFVQDINVSGGIDLGGDINFSGLIYGNGSQLTGLTESQITDLQTYLINNTAGWTANFTNIYSLDWTNVSITESQISDFQSYILTSNEGNLNVNNSGTLDGFDSTFFMPLNTSVFGDFDFNGGWENGGVSITNGDIFAQTLFVFNITSLNVTKQNLTILDNFIVNRNLTVDTNTLFVDSNNNRVGVGTTSPGAGLDVDTGALSGSSSPVIIWARDGAAVQGVLGYDHSLTDVYIGSLTNHALQFRTNDATRMFIENTGNVGIGTTAPADPLTVVGTLNVTDIQLSTNCADGQILKWVSGVGTCGTDDNSGGGGGNSSAWNRSGTDVFLANTGDNVGIGTTSPQTTLHILDSGTAGTPTLDTGAMGVFQNDGITTNDALIQIIAGTAGEAHIDFGDQGDANIGRIVYDNNVNDLSLWTLNTEALTIDSSQRVGIGTTSPVRKLHLNSTTTDVRMHLTTSTTGETASDGSDIRVNGASLFITNLEAANIIWSTSATEQMRLDSSGRLGIGTTSPDRKLAVETADGTNYSSTNMGFTKEGLIITNNPGSDTTNYAALTFQAAGGGTNGWGMIGLVREGTDRADMVFGTRQSSGNIIEAMRITKTGNVGIGTTSPSSTLEVAGNITMSGTGDEAKYIRTTGNAHLTLLSTGASGAIRFYTEDGGAPTERMRVNDDGNVGIGTSSPSSLLHVSGSGATPLSLSRSSAQNVNINFSSTTKTVFAGMNPAGDFGIGGSQDLTNAPFIFNVSSGNVGIGTTSPGKELEVNGTIRIGTSNLVGTIELGTGAQAILSSTTDVFRIRNWDGAAYQDVFYANEGNVGIGTTSPSYQLQVNNANTGGSPIFAIRNTDTSLNADSFISYQRDNAASGWSFGIDSTTNNMILSEAGASLGTPRVTFELGGNVGIGTTSPQGKLHIDKDTTTASDEGDYAIKIEDGTNDVGLLFGVDATNNVAYIQALDPSTSFTTRPLSLMAQGGNVGIGTTSPDKALHVKTTADKAAVFEDDDNPEIVFLDANAATNRKVAGIGYNLEQIFFFNTTDAYAGATKSMVINTTSGQVGIGTTSPSNELEVNGDIELTNLFDNDATNFFDNTCTASQGVASISSTGALSCQTLAVTDTDCAAESVLMGDGACDTKASFGDGTGTVTSVATGTGIGGGTITTTGTLTVAGGTCLTADADGLSVTGNCIADAQITQGSIDQSEIQDDILDFVDFQAAMDLDESTTVTHAGFNMIYDLTTTGDFIIRDAGTNFGVFFDTGDVQLGNNNELYVDTSTGRVGIGGDTTPDEALSMSGNIDLNTGNILAVNKLTVTTIDPVYTIDNISYATYVASFSGGVKEEVTGVVMLNNGEYEIDFTNFERGSNLWLFYQATDFGRSMENLQIILTPSFNGIVWYTKNPIEKTITIHGSSDGEVSYRFTANRFDWRNWTNYNDDGSLGLILSEK